MSKTLQAWSGPLSAPPASPLYPLRKLAAVSLRRASHLLARLARKLAVASARVPARRPPELEFYAEAGAPEGALYLDGVLVGHLQGVTRL